MKHTPRLRLFPVFLAALTAASIGCGKKAAEPAPSGPAVSVPGLGISLDQVPAAFRVASNEGNRLVLVPADPKAGGALTLAAEPAESGLNLQEAVKRHRKEIESRPDGKYLGAQELSGPTGTAYWSRGRYSTSAGPVEETRVVTLDPSQQKILDLTYVYPAGNDSKDRVTALLDVVSEIEASTPAATEKPTRG